MKAYSMSDRGSSLPGDRLTPQSPAEASYKKVSSSVKSMQSTCQSVQSFVTFTNFTKSTFADIHKVNMLPIVLALLLQVGRQTTYTESFKLKLKFEKY